MYAAKVVMHVKQADSVHVIFPLLADCICQTRETTHVPFAYWTTLWATCAKSSLGFVLVVILKAYHTIKHMCPPQLQFKVESEPLPTSPRILNPAIGAQVHC